MLDAPIGDDRTEDTTPAKRIIASTATSVPATASTIPPIAASTRSSMEMTAARLRLAGGLRRSMSMSEAGFTLTSLSWQALCLPSRSERQLPLRPRWPGQARP
jgi:hypothetical protein